MLAFLQYFLGIGATENGLLTET
ncbi:uncharacterized protein METZ01_LOCUS321302, partial [marine metagenome]